MLRFTVICLCVSSIWALPSTTGHSKALPHKLTGPRIINGQQAREGQFPWQVAAYITNYDGVTGFCGGSIIAEDHIVTAGNCIKGAQTGYILTGSLTPNGGQVTNISRFIHHEAYNHYEHANDIALLRLATPLKFDDNTAIIPMATEELGGDVDVTVSGWGLTSADGTDISDSLNYVELSTITNTECSDYYTSGAILPGMVCARSSTADVKGACSGDNGGPAVTNADSNPVHVAIVSFMSTGGCESDIPSGYTRTAYYYDWIQKQMKEP